MLYVIVFMSGAVLMSLEMIGSRLLAPTFGTSIYVWGALITVVMTALTLGYYLGGKAADRRPDSRAMVLILGVAGLLVGFLPFWYIPVSYSLAMLGPRSGSLVAAFAFFFSPLRRTNRVLPCCLEKAHNHFGRRPICWEGLISGS
ncbi:MAG: fused MFS/spermidine synthase [Firmicutes bacterium]|nr:fused MFS/spermidine synthase [Bacillota bacterium]